MIKRLAYLLIPIAMFIVFVAPYVKGAFGGYHEYITAHVMIALENLSLQGAINHRFRIIQSYPNESDKHIRWVTVRQMSSDGVGYYTTYPPMAVIYPYAVFNLLSIPFNEVAIRLFNLINSLVSAGFLFALILMIVPKYQVIMGIIGVFLYLFGYHNPWFFVKVYSWDTLFYYLLIIATYFFVLLISTSKKIPNAWLQFAFGITTAFTVYTEYQGIFFSFGAVIFCLLFRRQIPAWVATVVIAFVATVMPLAAVIVQYGSINGVQELWSVMYHKAFNEYGTFGSCEGGCEVTRLLLFYAKNYWFHLILLLFFGLALRIKTKLSVFYQLDTRQKATLFVMFVPIVLHHALLLRDIFYHDFASIKFSVFAAAGVAILLSKLAVYITRHSLLLIGVFICVMTVIISWVSLQKRITPGYTEYTARYSAIGSIIRSTASVNEAVFIAGVPLVNPQITYYAKRNITKVDTEAQATDILRDRNLRNGVLYIFDDAATLVEAKRIRLK